MSEKNSTPGSADNGIKDSKTGSGAVADSVGKESADRENVGDLLKKERLTRRITAETIAKDLKLNVGYIKALEASDYAALPPEPYVRVYIKSLTKYLSLDTDRILREFDRERGVIADELDKTANKIDVTVQRQEKNPAFVVIIALIVILAVFAYVANKKDWLSNDVPYDEYIPITAVDDTVSVNKDSLSLEAADDSTIASLSAPPDDTSAIRRTPATAPRPRSVVPGAM